MRSNISKHWAGKGYNSPLKQITTKTKLKDVPKEAASYIEKGINKIGNTTVGEVAGYAADLIAGPAAGAAVRAGTTAREWSSRNDSSKKIRATRSTIPARKENNAEPKKIGATRSTIPVKKGLEKDTFTKKGLEKDTIPKKAASKSPVEKPAEDVVIDIKN